LFSPLLLLLLYGQLLVLGVLSMVWNLVAIVLHPLLPRDTGARIGRAVIAYAYRAFWEVTRWSGMMRMDADVLDALRDDRGLIVVANHPSLLDALMLVARLPRSVCVMKASLRRNPLLGPGARLARYIRNDSPAGMVKHAVRELRAGGQLVLFPEGTRTTGYRLQPFKPGFVLISRLAHAPIQAVFIDTDSPYLSKGWPLWRLPPLPITFSVRLGKRFEPSTDDKARLAEIEQYYAEELRRPPRRP